MGRWLLLVALSAACRPAPRAAAEPADTYLFSYFTRNGEDGLHLAMSANGTTWESLNGGASVLTPTVKGKGRDWQ